MSEIVKVATGEIVASSHTEEMAMSIESVRAQVNLIQQVMRGVMQENQHYGKIPGCGDKPSLLKPGAEKLAMTFRLAPEYDIQVVDWPGGHREYQVKCSLRHIPTGNMVGEGHGTCSTMEGKYRFRSENTGQAVPKEYWDTRDPMLLGGPSFKARKVGQEGWKIFQEVEHPNPADYYNTCEKMGLKRAFVCAILSCTAASDIFTQDLEDMPEIFPQQEKTPTTNPKSRTLNEAEVTKFWTEMSKAKLTNAQVHKALKSLYHLESVKDIKPDNMDQIIASIIASEVDATAVDPGQSSDETGLFDDEPSPSSIPVVLTGMTVPYGDYKGKDYAELPDSELAKTIKELDMDKKLNDPKWGARNKKILDVCRAEAERRMKG